MKARIVAVVCMVVSIVLQAGGVCAQETNTGTPAVLRAESAKSIVNAYLAALKKGDTPTLLSLSDVPFARDGKEVFESMSQLKAHLDQGGKAFLKLKDVSVVEIVILNDRCEIVDDCFVIDRIVVQVTISDGKEKASLKFCIRPGDAYKVVGIRG